MLFRSGLNYPNQTAVGAYCQNSTDTECYWDSRNVIEIWLPPGFDDRNRYAVLYMHDGQMLFD